MKKDEVCLHAGLMINILGLLSVYHEVKNMGWGGKYVNRPKLSPIEKRPEPKKSFADATLEDINELIDELGLVPDVPYWDKIAPVINDILNWFN